MKISVSIRIMVISILILHNNYSAAQGVGINTLYAKSIFHIDAKGNNLSNTTDLNSEAGDDIVIINNGNMGIGILNPTAKLHISTQNNVAGTTGFRLEDGNQKINRALTSDKDGFATWKSIEFSDYQIIQYQRIQVPFTETPVGNSMSVYSNLYIDFPSPGNYLVSIGIKVEIDRTMVNPENMQLQGTFQPTPNPADWGTKRFVGAYPVAAVYPNSVLQYRIILCQQITIPADSLRAYFILTFWNSAYTAPGNIYTSWGNGGEPPEAHRTGGSIVRIN